MAWLGGYWQAGDLKCECAGKLDARRFGQIPSQCLPRYYGMKGATSVLDKTPGREPSQALSDPE